MNTEILNKSLRVERVTQMLWDNGHNVVSDSVKRQLADCPDDIVEAFVYLLKTSHSALGRVRAYKFLDYFVRMESE